jgi:hypothetical protein
MKRKKEKEKDNIVEFIQQDSGKCLITGFLRGKVICGILLSPW